jgi:hypothetical protein
MRIRMAMRNEKDIDTSMKSDEAIERAPHPPGQR